MRIQEQCLAFTKIHIISMRPLVFAGEFYNVTFEIINLCQIDIKSPPPVLPLIELLCEIVVDPFKPAHNQEGNFIIIVEKKML